MKHTIKIGDKVNLFHAGFMIAVAGKSETAIYTVIKVGTKRIECTNYRGEKGFFAYHDTKTHLRTYKKIAFYKRHPKYSVTK